MEKQRTLQIIRRLSAPLLIIPAVLLLHAIARFVWVLHPAWLPAMYDNNSSPGCQLPSWGWLSCTRDVPRTFWNYDTDYRGQLISHAVALGLIILAVVVIAGVRAFIGYVFAPTFPVYTADAEEDLFISSCTNPHCPCPDHQEHDRFDYGRNCWVEREDEDEAAPQPSPYATN